MRHRDYGGAIANSSDLTQILVSLAKYGPWLGHVVTTSGDGSVQSRTYSCCSLVSGEMGFL